MPFTRNIHDDKKHATLAGGVAFICVLLFFGGLAYHIHKANVDSFKASLHANADRISEQLSVSTNAQLTAIDRMRDRWNFAKGTPENAWRRDAENYIEQMPGLIRLAVVDRMGDARANVTRNTLPADTDKNIFLHLLDKSPRPEKRHANTVRQFWSVAPDADGSRLLLLYPLQYASQSESGFLAVDYDAETLLTNALPKNTRNYYNISFKTDELQKQPQELRALAEKKSIFVYGRKYDFFIWPTNAMLDIGKNATWLAVLVLGSLISSLCGMLLYNLLLGQQKSREILRANELIKQSDEFSRIVIENAPTGKALVSADGKWLAANPAMCRILGYSEDELKKIDFQRITHPDYLEKDMELVKALLNGSRNTYMMEKKYIHKDGHEIWGLLSVALVREENGTPRFFISQVQDITAQKQNEEKFKTLFESSGNPHIIYSFTRGILDCNKAALTMLRAKNKSDILYKKMDRFIPKEHAAGTQTEHKEQNIYDPDTINLAAGDDNMLRGEVSHIAMDGEAFTVDTSISLINYEGRVEALVVWADITEKKNLIQQLENSNHELDRFASAASHDLQEPLRTICSFTELLARDYEESYDDLGKKYLQIILTSGQRMSKLIEELLTYARVGTESETIETFSLKELLDEILVNLKDPIEKTAAQVHIPADLPHLQENRGRFFTLFQNLISNALKYKAPDRAPEIRLSCKDHGPYWEFCVSDNGIGIKPEYLSQIFEPFKRLHSQQEYPGTGMGLALCRKIVHERRGRIWATAVPGMGTMMFFTLPKKPGALSHKNS